MTYSQNPQLVIFLIVLAILFVAVLIVAAVAWTRRRKAGLTVTNSTYGDNIDKGRVVNQGNTESADVRPGPPKWKVDDVDTAPGGDRVNERR